MIVLRKTPGICDLSEGPSDPPSEGPSDPPSEGPSDPPSDRASIAHLNGICECAQECAKQGQSVSEVCCMRRGSLLRKSGRSDSMSDVSVWNSLRASHSSVRPVQSPIRCPIDGLSDGISDGISDTLSDAVSDTLSDTLPDAWSDACWSLRGRRRTHQATPCSDGLLMALLMAC